MGLVKNLKTKFNICCNNAGENVAFKKACKQEGMGVKFNGHVKQKFVAFFNCIQNSLPFRKTGYGLKLPRPPCFLRIISSFPNKAISPFQQFLGKGKRNILSLVQEFGNMCITTYRDNAHQAKLANWAVSGLWVEFAEGCPADTYQVFNHKIKQIIWVKMWLSYRIHMEFTIRLKNWFWLQWVTRGWMMRRNLKWFL